MKLKGEYISHNSQYNNIRSLLLRYTKQLRPMPIPVVGQGCQEIIYSLPPDLRGGEVIRYIGRGMADR